MEYWDIYDRNRNQTGRTVKRGDALKDGEYHIVVQVWITDGNGRWVMTKRHPDKPCGRLWEPTAGSVTAGEDSLAGALRISPSPSPFSIS